MPTRSKWRGASRGGREKMRRNKVLDIPLKLAPITFHLKPGGEKIRKIRYS
jgi:hypothetical protein